MDNFDVNYFKVIIRDEQIKNKKRREEEIKKLEEEIKKLEEGEIEELEKNVERIKDIYSLLKELYSVEICRLRRHYTLRIKIGNETYSIACATGMCDYYYCEVYNLDTREEPINFYNLEGLKEYLEELNKFIS